MLGDFLKISKNDDEEDFDQSGQDQEAQDSSFLSLPVDSLQIRILNGISGASDEKVNEIFSAMKMHLRMPPEMESSFSEQYKKIQYIQKNITVLGREQLVNIAKSLFTT